MALFKKNTEEKKDAKAVVKAENKPEKKTKATKAVAVKKTDKKAEEVKDSKELVKGVIIAPRVAEKAAILSDKGVYTFVVSKGATKGKIYKAIKDKYKVEPVKINIINLPAKTVFVRGKFGTKSGVKKAVVFLKKGDKIEFI